MENSPRKIRKKIKKKPWLERNIKYVTIVFIFLFLVQSMRGCLNTSSLEREIKNQIQESDSLINSKNQIIFEKDSTIIVKNDYIQYLEYELKIAGVKVQAAEERAEAVQSTAEKVKNNSTTTIKIEADTTKNKIVQQKDTTKNN